MFSSNITRFANPNFLQFNAILIAGGASSGQGNGSFNINGGGGAGGVLIQNNIKFLKNSTITVTVGAGGAETGNFLSGNNGSNSIITIGNDYTAIGGGGGGGNGNGNGALCSAKSGGSGGGQSINVGGPSRPNTIGGTGTLGQGNNGGSSSSGGNGAGGGGGYSSVGQDANVNDGGAGGAGYSSTLSYTGKTYATGGNGSPIASPVAGTINTGNGGAGSAVSLAGGSGAVLIYVPTGLTFNLISGTVNTYTLAGFASVKEFITSGQFSLL